MYLVWWIIATIFECALGFSAIYLLLSRTISKNYQRHIADEQILTKELETKLEILTKFSGHSVSLIRNDHIKALQAKMSSVSAALKTEQSRIELTKTELANQENRLRELDEIEKELEISNFEAAKELAALREDEEKIAGRNLKLRQRLNDSLTTLDGLLVALQHSKESVDRLNRTKSELIAVEEKIDWFEREITEINSKYTIMKNSYDALDIEYAQLYEKQSD